jgi:serine/threonine protein phosphatase PrpC
MPAPEDFLCSAEQNLGWAFGCSRTGASHRKTVRPCEDAFALWSGSVGASPCIAIAVADGHGDSRHDQSRIGASIAVSAAILELIGFHRSCLHDAPASVICGEFRMDFPRRVTRRWREEVKLDSDKRGITGSGADDGAAVTVRYGSTLIAALILEESILIGQIGDGDIVLVRPDGTIECPIPQDPSVMGKETRSLASRDAHLLWRTATLDRGVGGVLIASTDGVSDSFDTTHGDEFLKFTQSLVARIREFGIESVAGSMSGWLDRYSEMASGDDMTLVYVCINPALVQEEKHLLPGNETRGSGWGF